MDNMKPLLIIAVLFALTAGRRIVVVRQS